MKQRLLELFQNYDPAIQKVIAEVLAIEKQHISYQRPRVKEPIDEIISRIAKRELERTEDHAANADS